MILIESLFIFPDRTCQLSSLPNIAYSNNNASSRLTSYPVGTVIEYGCDKDYFFDKNDETNVYAACVCYGWQIYYAQSLTCKSKY